MQKVVITDYFKESIIEQNIFGEKVKIVCLNEKNEEKFDDKINDADAILVWHATLTNKTFKKLKKCKAIVRYGVGYDNIDISAANNAGIKCANTPDYGIDEVADTACAMITSLLRRIFFYNYKSKSYNKTWQENVLKENINSPIRRSNEHKLGIIGAGRIGSAVALRMKNFGMKVGFYDPYLDHGYEKTIGVSRFESIKDIIKFSSIISVHAVLTSETKSMVNANFINQLNEGTIFVNTARGAIVDKLSILYDGLISGKLDSVGLDVLPDEPPLDSDPLIKAWKDEKNSLSSRIIINPHSAYYSSKSIKEMRVKAADNVNRVLKGLELRNIIR